MHFYHPQGGKYLSSRNANPYANRSTGAQGAASTLTSSQESLALDSKRPAGSSTPRNHTRSSSAAPHNLLLAEESPSRSLQLIPEAFMHPWQAALQC